MADTPHTPSHGDTLALIILEDEHERREAMRAVLHEWFPEVRVTWFANARTMITWLNTHAHTADLYSLDHDLHGALAGDQPGDGREVVDALITHAPPRPVLIHSSNGPAASSMHTALTLARWPARRVVPIFGLDWISTFWADAIDAMITTRTP